MLRESWRISGVAARIVRTAPSVERWARFVLCARARSHPQRPGGAIRTLVVSLLGAAAVAAGLVLIRQQKLPDPQLQIRDVHAGESQPGTISLEKLRELGY